jgi:hypothetical protein
VVENLVTLDLDAMGCESGGAESGEFGGDAGGTESGEFGGNAGGMESCEIGGDAGDCGFVGGVAVGVGSELNVDAQSGAVAVGSTLALGRSARMLALWTAPRKPVLGRSAWRATLWAVVRQSMVVEKKSAL